MNQYTPLLGKKVSRLIVGTSRYAATKNTDGTFMPVHHSDLEEVNLLRYAADLGLNAIDTAHAYGDSEIIVGQAIKSNPRPNVFVMTKVGYTRLSSSQIQQQISSSNHRLGTIPDITFMHDRWPGCINEFVHIMDQSQDRGLVAGIGASNFQAVELQQALNMCRHPIVAYQARVNPVKPRPDFVQLLSICRKNHIPFMASSSLNRGDLPTTEFDRYQPIVDKYSLTVVQLSLLILLSLGLLPIFQSHSQKHIQENHSALLTNISHDDQKLLAHTFLETHFPDADLSSILC